MVTVVGLQPIVILLALGIAVSQYLLTSSEFLIWRYDHGMRDFRRAALPRGTSLQGAMLAGPNPSGADLMEASLYRADLRGAKLHQSDLSGANLSGEKVTAEQLAQAKSFKGATLPDGSVHE